jgi:hypothetical protein
MKRAHRNWILAAAAALIALSVVAMYPHVNPSVIHWKAKVLGPRLTYGPLASREEVWDSIVAGVRSGEWRWLRVAVDLQPALDTHPGEEMVDAITSVIDANPHGAIQWLLPAYGAELVCGEEGAGVRVAGPRRQRRKALVEKVTDTAGTAACLEVLQ